MLKKLTERLHEYNEKLIAAHFESEDMAKDILYYAKDKEEFEIAERRKFLDRKIDQRKNLYIYPRKVNV